LEIGKWKLDKVVKSLKFTSFVIPANPGSGPGQAPESSKFNRFWMPDQARHDDYKTFYETIKLDA
jgi:hypothetical protein